MKPNDIVHAIDRYLDDSTSEYAVMLTGDWGTGKTHFVKNELANKLANRADKTAVIRVSLMGTSSADEVYGRIVQAAFASNVPLPENYENSAGAKAAKAALNTVVGFAAKKLEDVGLSYQLPADACASIMLPKNCLIVLDDLERCPHLAYHDLYGLMSSLVEGQGRKVLLVCNDKEPGFLEKGAEDASAKAALEEKLVWARYRFEPDADDIVSSVMAQSFNGLRWKDEAFEATAHALRQAGGNIRSLKKTRKLIDEALNTRFLEDETVDKSRKARTLGTIALLSLRCASGKPPVWEHNAQQEDYYALVMAGAIDPLEERLAAQLAKLPFVTRFFEGAYDIDPAAIDEAIRKFADSEYPESQAELAALSGEGLIRMSLPEDDEVVSAVEAITGALSSGAVGVSNIPRMLKALLRAKEWGFLSDSEFEDACKSSERILLNDPVLSYGEIRSSGSEWATSSIFATGEIQDELRRLKALVMVQNEELWANDIVARVTGKGELSGRTLADAFAECNEIAFRLPSFPVDKFAECVAESNMDSISALRGFFRRVFNDAQVDEGARGNLSAWMIDASSGLAELQLPSRMRSLSVKYLAGDLKSLSEKHSGQG